MSKSIVRNVKNLTHGYSSVQVKVRNATSNEPWGPVGSDMAEIAALTFNNPEDFYQIMDMLDKRLNDKGKNWRHVLKALKVLDYCLHEGSELVVTWARKNLYIIKTLREFQYIEEKDNRDVGQNVRTAAKELTLLILDEDRLRSERSDRKLWKTRVHGLDEYGPQGGGGGGGSPAAERPPRRRPTRNEEDDTEFKLALEASKVEEEERQKRERDRARNNTEDDDLAKALRLSKEEEELRRRELEDQNAASLFDDTPVSTQPQPTGYNQGYQQQPAVDWFGNPLQQQPQSTGFLNNAYAQPQPTGFQNGYAFQPQQTGYPVQPGAFDQFGSQPFLPQQNSLQPQQTAFHNNNPYSLTPDVFGQQQPLQSQPQQQQQQQQQPLDLQPGSHNPWAQNNNQTDSLKPMPTGSNNPFAPKTQSPPPFQRPTQQPTLNTLYESQPTRQFSPSQPNPITNFQAPSPPAQPQFQQPTKPMDPHAARLNALLASGEGQDTFGNTGDLRIPAQHTAPGTFVNSAGGGMDRLRAAQTGNNPFFTVQSTGYGQAASGQMGASYGARPGQQNGSLIDL